VNEEIADIERRLAERFPELTVAPLRHLETGFGSIVVDTSSRRDRVLMHARRKALVSSE
jgi:hypothetical protein